MNGQPATIGDVAREAGVSAATVSRALRDLPNVAPSTRARVQQAATRLAYRPDPSASRLATGRTATVVALVPILDAGYFGAVIAGAESVLSSNGYDLVVSVVDPPTPRRAAVVHTLMKRADGMILVNVALTDAEAAMLREWSGVVVSVGMEFDLLSAVVVDDFEVARTATAHLLELGHADIASLTGAADDPMSFAVPHRRRDGYRAALADGGVPHRAELEREGGFTIRGGYDAMVGLLDLDRPPTAVFAMSDEMAFGAMRAARDRGMHVPGDLSLVGVDDHPMSWVVELTTVDQQVTQHGARAAAHVIDCLREAADHGVSRIEIGATLVPRGSTAPAP